MKCEYEKLYCMRVDSFFRSSKRVQESFVFQGSCNWDMYCEAIYKHRDYELFENVELLGFDTMIEVHNFEIAKEKIIDFSREHSLEKGVEKYFLLVQK